MNRELHWYDAITVNIYFLGLTTIAQTMTPLVVPLLVQQFVGTEQQGAFYGNIRLWSLMVAILVQSLMGSLSDRSTLPWGRRRPFIFTGTLASLVFMAAIGFSAGMEGRAGYAFLFVMLLLLSAASNTAQGAVQGLIPDLVPEKQRGRFSGVKAVLEAPLPVILVSFTIGRMIAAGQFWGGILTAMGILTITMIAAMLAPETRLQEKPPAFDWAPFIRLAIMTGIFTAVILGMGALVRLLSRTMAGVESLPALLLEMGLIGVAAMAAAVALGVWLSVRASLGVGAVQKNPAFTWWVVSRLAFLVGSTNLASFAVYFLQGRLGLVREQAAGPASRLVMIVGVFILVMAIPSGWLADRFGRKPLLVVSGLSAALGTLIVILAPNLTIIYLGGILIGCAAGLFYTANWALGTDLVPKAEAGRYLGISNLAGAGAGAIGAYIGGPIADFFTVTVPQIPALGYVLLFSIYIGLFLLSVAALGRVPEGRQKVAVAGAQAAG